MPSKGTVYFEFSVSFQLKKKVQTTFESPEPKLVVVLSRDANKNFHNHSYASNHFILVYLFSIFVCFLTLSPLTLKPLSLILAFSWCSTDTRREGVKEDQNFSFLFFLKYTTSF